MDWQCTSPTRLTGQHQVEFFYPFYVVYNCIVIITQNIYSQLIKDTFTSMGVPIIGSADLSASNMLMSTVLVFSVGNQS